VPVEQSAGSQPLTTEFPLPGRCACGIIRYEITSTPLIVHCCHCRWCQRETGSAFVINAVIEDDRVRLMAGRPQVVNTASESGRGQLIARCPDCQVALFSNYAGGGRELSFVRVGTLEQPDLLPPDVHIYTQSKQPWVMLPPGAPSALAFYDLPKLWTEENQQRLARHKAQWARKGTRRDW
jgi:hypothetical protein